jgi:hypothetical protein
MQQHYRKVAFHVASALDCAQQGRCIALRTAINCRGYLLSAGKEVCTMTADGFAGAVLKIILLLFVSHSPGSKSAGTLKDMPLSNPDGMVNVLAVVSCPVCSQQLSFQFTAQLDAQPPMLFSLHCIMSIPSHT